MISDDDLDLFLDDFEAEPEKKPKLTQTEAPISELDKRRVTSCVESMAQYIMSNKEFSSTDVQTMLHLITQVQHICVLVICCGECCYLGLTKYITCGFNKEKRVQGREVSLLSGEAAKRIV